MKVLIETNRMVYILLRFSNKGRKYSRFKEFLCDHSPNMGMWWSRGQTIGVEISFF